MHSRRNRRSIFVALAAIAPFAACRAPNVPAPAPAPTGYVLTGRVVDPQGRPLANVPVRTHGGFATRWQTGETRTDVDGRFHFDAVEGSWIGDDSPRTALVGVCVGETVGALNPAAYLPWHDVRIAHGVPLDLEVTLDGPAVAAAVAKLQER